VTHLRKAMLEELQRRNLSPITTRIYLRAVEEFAQYYNKRPDRLGPNHIRSYQAHLFTDHSCPRQFLRSVDREPSYN
jgi:integrase/recombinase XerD